MGKDKNTMQTRLQKLELLRKALLTATRSLFPEITQENISIMINLHSGYQLANEAKKAEFNFKAVKDGTCWYDSMEYYGDITIFYHDSDVKDNENN